MMDGSYKGYEYYQRVLRRLEETKGNKKKLRSLAISIAMDALQVEFSEISRSTIQKQVIHVFGPDIEKVNDELIEDLIDFAKDHDIAWAKERK
jgi:hypothetical protein